MTGNKEGIFLPPIRIEKLVTGGAGLGFSNGAVFVPLTAPGDLVVPENVRKAKGTFFAEPGMLLERGPERREPPCPWFGECGGCLWMHLDYPSQVRWKEAISLEAFSRIGNFREFRFESVWPSSMETGYRHRARLQISGGRMGFFRRGTRKVVEWDRCLLLPDSLNAAVGALRSLFHRSPPPIGLRSCEGAVNLVDGSVSFHWVLDGGKSTGKELFRKMDRLEYGLDKHSVRIAGQVLRDSKGKVLAERGGPLRTGIQGEELLVSPGVFSQVNPFVNRSLVDRTLNVLKERGISWLLDLYCGMGNFSVPAALAGMRVDGVESNPSAVRDARAAGCPNCRFHLADAGHFLEGRTGQTGRWDAVLVDPPRTGLPSHLTKGLVKMPVGTLVYVSCDPGTLARDLAILTEGGYFIEKAELFDMFPQTPHGEMLVVMGR